MTKTHEVSAAGLPTGWTRISDDVGDTIGCPPNWTEGALSKSAFESSVRRLGSNGKAEPSSVQGAERLAEENKIKLMVFGQKFHGSHAMVMLVVRPNYELQSLQLIGDSVKKAELKADSKAEATGTTLAAGPAELVTYTLTSRVTGAMINHSSYALLKDGTYYYLDFAIPDGDSDDAAQVPAMANSFTIKG